MRELSAVAIEVSFWVKSAILNASWSLPVCADKRTISEPVRTSHSGHNWTLRGSKLTLFDHLVGAARQSQLCSDSDQIPQSSEMTRRARLGSRCSLSHVVAERLILLTPIS
jgi:hypothetical protein